MTMVSGWPKKKTGWVLFSLLKRRWEGVNAKGHLKGGESPKEIDAAKSFSLFLFLLVLYTGVLPFSLSLSLCLCKK